VSKYKVLISIDALFDTYLGTVTKLYPDEVINLIKKGYYSRHHNKLSFFNKQINDSVIEKHYQSRDKSILKLSGRTNMFSLIGEHISHSKGNPDHPSSVDYNIVINTYPYELTKVELKELFTCFKWVFGLETIKRIHLPTSQITLTYLKEHFNKFIIYDFNEWYGHHVDEITKTKTKIVSIVLPLWLMEGKENYPNVDDVIRFTSILYSPIFDLEFVMLADMSYCPPKEFLKTNKEPTEHEL